MSASEMTYIVSGGALNSTHSLSPNQSVSHAEALIHRCRLLTYLYIYLLTVADTWSSCQKNAVRS